MKIFFMLPATSVRSIRIGVTEAYVECIRNLGTDWLAGHLPVFLNKVLEVVAHPKVRLLSHRLLEVVTVIRANVLFETFFSKANVHWLENETLIVAVTDP